MSGRLSPHRRRPEGEALLRQGISDSEVARRIGAGQTTVRIWRLRLGLPVAKARPVPPVGSPWGRWTVLGAPFWDEHHNRRLPCRCACGTERAVCLGTLLRGESRSCGCGRHAST